MRLSLPHSEGPLMYHSAYTELVKRMLPRLRDLLGFLSLNYVQGNVCQCTKITPELESLANLYEVQRGRVRYMVPIWR